MPPSVPSVVAAVCLSPTHSFSKHPQEAIAVLADHGVAGDAHAGATVRHRFARRKEPTKPNLRQIHLIPKEFLDDLAGLGFDVPPGGLGENVLTEGLDLLSLPIDTRLRLGTDAVVRLTGRRSPCSLIDKYRPGLLKHCFAEEGDRGKQGRVGVLGVVEAGGTIRGGDAIEVLLPALPHHRLEYL